MIKRILLSLLAAMALLSGGGAMAQEVTCEYVGKTCVDSGSKNVSPSNDGSAPNVNVSTSDNCWEYERQYECYADETEVSCVDEADKLEGCKMAKQEVIETSSDGEPLVWDEKWICPEDATSECVGPNIADDTTHDQLENRSNCTLASETCNEKVGGECVDFDATYSCQEASESCLSGEINQEYDCDLVDSSCSDTITTQSGETQCVEQDQTWECTKTNAKCVEKEIVNKCTGPETYSLEDYEKADNTQAFEDAATAMTLANEMQENFDEDTMTMFPGEEIMCKDKELPIANDCCGPEVTSTKGIYGYMSQYSGEVSDFMNQSDSMKLATGGQGYWFAIHSSLFEAIGQVCEEHEATLARHMRQDTNYRVVRDDYVRPYIDLFVGGFCSFTEKKAEWHCAFENKLARIIQVQGRQQLKQIASGGAKADSGSVSFDYLNEPMTDSEYIAYLKNERGLTQQEIEDQGLEYGVAEVLGPSETTSVTVGGETARFTTFPYQCYQYSSSDNAACPDSLEVEGTLSGRPFTVQATASDEKFINNSYLIEPNQFDTYCDMDSQSSTYRQCSITVNKLGSGSGGTGEVQASLTFSRVSESGGWSEPVHSKDDRQYQGYQHPYDADFDKDGQVRIRYAETEGGTDHVAHSWNETTIPSDISASDSVKIGSDTRIYGECKDGYCNYTVFNPAPPNPKNWIDDAWTQESGCEHRYSLDCSGFTIDQFRMLDIDEMDLSDWIDDVKKEAKADMPTAQETQRGVQESADEAMADAEDVTYDTDGKDIEGSENFADAYGTVEVDPSEAIVGQPISIKTISAWPENGSGNPISTVTVDWGDGSKTSLNKSGAHFTGSHAYNDVGEFEVHVTFNMPDGTEYINTLTLISETPYGDHSISSGTSK